MCVKPCSDVVLSRTRVDRRHEQPSHAHSNPEPVALRPVGLGAPATRQFGGVGLMIDSPGIDLTVEPATSWLIEGSLTERVEQLITRLQRQSREAGLTLPAAHIRVASVPPEHIGLGVGTQLCLAVARAVLSLAGRGNLSTEELARWTSRGRRSGIGLHGFQHGGLIVDGGRRNDADIPPLLARLPFPADWSILIVRPRGESGLHGPDENRAFDSLPACSRTVTDSLCRLVLLEILPAVIERDLPAFGAALGELQAHVGACFAPAQGGIYAARRRSDRRRATEPRIRRRGAELVGSDTLRLLGMGEPELCRHAEQLRQQFGLDQKSVFQTRAANHGARMFLESEGNHSSIDRCESIKSAQTCD